MEKKAPEMQYSYCCKKCRQPLFKEELLAEHKTDPKKFKGKDAPTKYEECSSYFTNQPDWVSMKDYANTGKIFCPNPKVFFNSVLIINKSVDKN